MYLNLYSLLYLNNMPTYKKKIVTFYFTFVLCSCLYTIPNEY